jgi:modulator of FtsH protease HflC
MKIGAALLMIVAVVIGVVAFNALFTVHQTQQALVLQFGNPVRVEQEPGLKVKMPFVQNVEYYDNRILDLDPPAQEIILKDQKRVNVDAFARYKIIDPLEYKKTAKTNANFLNVFGQRLNSAIRAEIGQILLGDMLTQKRAEIMARIAALMKTNAKAFGVEVIDVRIGRTDLPQDTAQSVYNRMRSDRIASAAEIRAVGEQQKLNIEAKADRERTVILAEAQRMSEILRGEGEGERNRILVTAQNQDPEFFAFYRSMEAYGASLKDGTTWVLSPDSEFFRYFNEVPVQSSGN